MNIRRAKEKDIERLMELLGQVLQIHADIRPDIFIPGTTKYTKDELAEMIKDDTKPIYVAVDEKDDCLGYAFCQLRKQPFSENMIPFTALFIDDLCVDAKTRGQHIGEHLFEYVKEKILLFKVLYIFICCLILSFLVRQNNNHLYILIFLYRLKHSYIL